MLNRIDVKYFKLADGLDAIGKETTVDVTARCPVWRFKDSQEQETSAPVH